MTTGRWADLLTADSECQGDFGSEPKSDQVSMQMGLKANSKDGGFFKGNTGSAALGKGLSLADSLFMSCLSSLSAGAEGHTQHPPLPRLGPMAALGGGRGGAERGVGSFPAKGRARSSLDWNHPVPPRAEREACPTFPGELLHLRTA